MMKRILSIKPPFPFDNKPAFSDLLVYCNMTMTENKYVGGWTLMSNSLSDSMSNKTYEEYVAGFGESKEKDLWLGLEKIHKMTTETNTNLRINIHRCETLRKPALDTYCTYVGFKVLGNETSYSVSLPFDCIGSEDSYMDGWVRWTTEIGPPFSTFDHEYDDKDCSNYYLGTGWWFDHEHLCGAANLNGKRYRCDNKPNRDLMQHYITWDSNPISAAELYLRPVSFPELPELHHPTKPRFPPS